MGPGTDLDACGKSFPHRDSIPGPDQKGVATPTAIPAHTVQVFSSIKYKENDKNYEVKKNGMTQYPNRELNKDLLIKKC